MAILETKTLVEEGIANAYASAGNKGATIPAQKNIKNLAGTIESIQSGGGGGGVDVSDTTATPSDVKYGKVFHLSNGNRAVGTVGTFTAQEVTYNRTLNTNGKIVDGDIVINIGGGDIKQNDLNAVMTGNFYDILTDSFIDQIMTGHYIKKGE